MCMLVWDIRALQKWSKNPKTLQVTSTVKQDFIKFSPCLSLTRTHTHTPIWRNNEIRTNWVCCVLDVAWWDFHRDPAVHVSPHLSGFSRSAHGSQQMTPYLFNLSHDPWEFNQFLELWAVVERCQKAENLTSDAALIVKYWGCLSNFLTVWMWFWMTGWRLWYFIPSRG